MQANELICTSPMSMRDFEATIAHLAERPIEHAGLLALVRRAQSTESLRRQFVLAHSQEGTICGVMFAGPQIMLSCSNAEATLAFARMERQPRVMRALMGPEQPVALFINECNRTARKLPRIDTIQHLYVLNTLALETMFMSDHVAQATLDDLDTIVHGAAAMIGDELGYDPRRRPTFRREILNQIQGHRWWIAQDKTVQLLCRIGATTQETMQLECIWSPPESRGYGHATRSLATICAHLLKRRSSLSLAVNANNDRALRLYKKLGFIRYSTQRTILW